MTSRLAFISILVLSTACVLKSYNVCFLVAVLWLCCVFRAQVTAFASLSCEAKFNPYLLIYLRKGVFPAWLHSLSPLTVSHQHWLSPTTPGYIPYHSWLYSLPLLATFPATPGYTPYHSWLYSLPLLATFPTTPGYIPYHSWLYSLPLLATFPSTSSCILYHFWL